MRLLTKAQVNIQAQELKRQQISEGQELASKITEMRKALASLQAQHMNFVEKSKEELHRETTELYGQVITLRSEVDSLTVIREELKKPFELDKQKLREDQFELQKQRDNLLDDKTKLSDKQAKLEGERLQVQEDSEQAVNLRKLAESNYQQSLEDKGKAEKVLGDANAKADRIEKEIASKLLEAEKQEKALEFERQGIEQAKKINTKREKYLNDRERAINDKYEVLQRNLKRITK